GEAQATPRGGAADAGAQGAPRGEGAPRGGRSGRRGPGGERPPGGENPAPQNPAPQNPTPQNPTPATPTPTNPAQTPNPQAPNPQAPNPQTPAATPAPAEEKPPERPQYPPQPPRDPAKDALIALRDGKLALFVEVDRAEEVTRALELARQHGVKRLVLELATRAADAVAAIAEAGVPVVVAGSELPPIQELGEGVERRPIAALLAERLVPIAIGSASVERARHLPSIAAEAVGAGVPEDVALRALTLDAAELLGVARDCGSLEPGKLGDVVLTSAPLLASESRVLRVLSAGRTIHEAR
ncbi:MAG: amidohydrolase family protein, partial [Planctomycetes bacterium]|nr:amidohydrolase family protein [Planctomycetota bacterium]